MWIVVGMNGEPLPPAHGFPARLLVANRYGYKSAKWLERITFASEAITSTWQQLGYPDDGTNRPAGFVHQPTPAQTLFASRMALMTRTLSRISL